MALEIRLQGRTLNKTVGGMETNITRVGTKDEALSACSELKINARYAGLGRLVLAAAKQESPKIWVLEERYIEQTDGINIVTPPDDGFGKKSATLSTGMITLPLESVKGYKTKWNHYLAGTAETTVLPDWANTASSTIVDEPDKYRWIKEPGELPQGWHILSEPSKPGVTGVDLATYTITERIKCRSPRSAGKEIVRRLNRIGKPVEDFGIDEGDWKCDDSGIQWDGKAWVATLTWTRSGDEKGWDKELYKKQ